MDNSGCQTVAGVDLADELELSDLADELDVLDVLEELEESDLAELEELSDELLEESLLALELEPLEVFLDASRLSLR